MKKLCFEYRGEKKRIKEIIKNNKMSRFDAFATGSMYVMIKGDKLKLKKKAIYQHPLQRVFCGNIESSPVGTKISGSFQYPCINVIAFLLIMISLLVGNCSVVMGSVELTTKIYTCVIFVLMYLIILGFFITGRLMFKKQELDVIEFLIRLEKE